MRTGKARPRRSCTVLSGSSLCTYVTDGLGRHASKSVQAVPRHLKGMFVGDRRINPRLSDCPSSVASSYSSSRRRRRLSWLGALIAEANKSCQKYQTHRLCQQKTLYVR